MKKLVSYLKKLVSYLLAISFIAGLAVVSGCSKEQPNLKLVSVNLVNNSKGSENFNRMLRFCFNEPIKNFYWHTIELETYDRFKFKGKARFFPLASDPDNKCQDKNLYLYVDKNSPTGARQLLETRVVVGNIKRLKVTLFKNNSDNQPGEEMFSRTFKDM